MTARAVIISAQRSGGLFLAGCLSNHPDVHCPREEPFRRQAIWQQKLKLGHAALLDFVLSEPYYQVSMCRLTYDQAFNEQVHGYLVQRQVAIIHLVRAVMPTVTSTLLAKQEIAKGVPRHSFDGTFEDNEVLEALPSDVMNRIKRLLQQRKQFASLYAGSEQLVVRYEAMTRGGRHLSVEATNQICDFLGVHRTMLHAHNRKMHKRPIESYYRHWKAIKALLDEHDWEGVDLWPS